MVYNVCLHPKANTAIKKLDPSIKKRIKQKLKELEQRPNRGEHLKYSAFWKLRIGDYRAIYEIIESEKKILVIFIGNRKNVYDKLERFLYLF